LSVSEFNELDDLKTSHETTSDIGAENFSSALPSGRNYAITWRM